MKKIIVISTLITAVVFAAFQTKPQAKKNIIKIYYDENSAEPSKKSPEDKNYSFDKTLAKIIEIMKTEGKGAYIRSFSGYEESDKQILMDKRTNHIHDLLLKAGVEKRNIILEMTSLKWNEQVYAKSKVDTAKTEDNKIRLRSFNRYTEVKLLKVQ